MQAMYASSDTEEEINSQFGFPIGRIIEGGRYHGHMKNYLFSFAFDRSSLRTEDNL